MRKFRALAFVHGHRECRLDIGQPTHRHRTPFGTVEKVRPQRACARRLEHDADVAIEDAQRRVVARHHHGPAFVPLAAPLQQAPVNQGTLDARVQARHAPRPFAHRAQHAESVEVNQHLGGPGPEGCRIGRALTQRVQVSAVAALRTGAAVDCQASDRAGVRRFDQRHRCVWCRPQRCERRRAITPVHGQRQFADWPAEAAAVSQHDRLLGQAFGAGRMRCGQVLAREFANPVDGGRVVRVAAHLGARTVAQVAHHGTRFHRGQLVTVAQQHHARAGRQRIQQRGHHFQVDHRGLVDEEQVDVQRVGRVVHEAPRARARAKQRVQGARRAERSRPGRQRQRVAQLLLQTLQRGADGLPQARSGLARGRRERHPQRLCAGMQGLQQHEQPRGGVGLASAGPAGDEGQPPAQGQRAGYLLPIGPSRRTRGGLCIGRRREQPVQEEACPGTVQRRREVAASAVGHRARSDLLSDARLVAPVPAQEEEPIAQHQGR